MPTELSATPLHLLALEDALKIAGISPSDSAEDRLKKAGIRHFDELIHKQPKAWLVKNFGEAGGKYPVNVARLIRNLIVGPSQVLGSALEPDLRNRAPHLLAVRWNPRPCRSHP